MLRAFPLTLTLASLTAAAAAPAPLPTAALLPPGGPADSAELGMLIQARASSLLGATGRYTIFHVKQILRMAELEGVPEADLSLPEVANRAREHLGASRVAWGRLTPRPGGGWDLDVSARAALPPVKRTQAHLPSGVPEAIEAGARALASAVTSLDGTAVPDSTADAHLTDEAWRAYGACYARIVRQPIGIENPTVLAETELANAVASCRQALSLVPGWEAARSTLAIALAIQGRDKEAVGELAKLSPDAKAHAFYWIGRFWLVTRYQSNDAWTAVLRAAIDQAPNSLLLRGYLAEQLNAIGHQEEALTAWQDYRTLAPDSPFVLARLGYTLSRLHRDKEALEVTRAAVERDPSSTNLKLELASRLIDAGTPEQAIEVLTPLATSDARAEISLRLGYAQLMADHLDAAEPLIERALAQAQQPSEWRTRARAKYDLAKLYLRRGHPDQAREAILDALVAGYKPYALAREDKDLMVIARAAELSQRKRVASPMSLTPKPREASPFELNGAGEVDPERPKPAPPEGFALIHFGA
jgi:tetratricopeptide (TPR) repeat protein